MISKLKHFLPMWVFFINILLQFSYSSSAIHGFVLKAYSAKSPFLYSTLNKYILSSSRRNSILLSSSLSQTFFSLLPSLSLLTESSESFFFPNYPHHEMLTTHLCYGSIFVLHKKVQSLLVIFTLGLTMP